MFDDDLDPRHRKAGTKSLDPLSIDELKNYIVELKAEIDRAEAEIVKKQSHKSAADSVFR